MLETQIIWLLPLTCNFRGQNGLHAKTQGVHKSGKW
jgi:hypothetical protein